MPTYRWPTDEPTTITADHQVSPLVATLLTNRQVAPDGVADFLAPDYDQHLHDPLTLHDMQAACARIESAMDSGQQIVVFADYDCDGIPGAVVAHDFFTAAKYQQVSYYIPHRHYEGFGLSVGAVEKLAEEGANLIITIDCGVTDVAAVARANELGVNIIITDHHEPAAELPAAVAIVNPKLGDYAFEELCGAAVMFKLAQALLSRRDYGLVPGYEKWWLDMVGVATIADMVPLVDENRVLATYGLQVLRKSRRPGLQQLLKKVRADQRFLTEDDVGFTIGPRVNAASRMDTPEDAFYLLTASTVEDAAARVTHLEALNQTRKTTVAQITKQLHQKLHQLDELPDVLVFGDPTWRPSLVGLTASKLAEEYNRPTFIWGRDGNDKYKGSCRSGGGVSVVQLLRAAAHTLHEHGGHHAAGGFTVRDESIHDFAAALNQAYVDLGSAALVTEERTIDAVLQLADVNRLLITDLNRLAPYGTGNPQPLFAFKNVTPGAVDQFGKGQEHLKLTFTTDTGTLEAINFFSTPDQYSRTPTAGEPLTLIAHAEESRFAGRTSIRLRIIDIL